MKQATSSNCLACLAERSDSSRRRSKNEPGAEDAHVFCLMAAVLLRQSDREAVCPFVCPYFLDLLCPGKSHLLPFKKNLLQFHHLGSRRRNRYVLQLLSLYLCVRGCIKMIKSEESLHNDCYLVELLK